LIRDLNPKPRTSGALFFLAVVAWILFSRLAKLLNEKNRLLAWVR